MDVNKFSIVGILSFFLSLSFLVIGILTIFIDIDYARLTIFLLWLFGFTVIPPINFVGRYFYFAFGLFFVVPILLNGVGDYLTFGQFIESIYLSERNVLTLLVAIILFQGGFIVNSALQLSRPTSDFKMDRCNCYSIKNIKLFYLFVVVSFVVISVFYVAKIIAIQKYGYLAYHRGELPVKKGFLLLLVEFAMISGLVFGIHKKEILCYLMVILYGLLIMLTGLRTPGATIIFFSSLYYFSFLRKNFLFVFLFSVFVAPPVLNIIQYFRFFGVEGLTLARTFEYKDVFKVLGITIDTLKAGIDLKDSGEYISLFYKPISILYVFLERVFGFDASGFRVSLGSFGAVATKYYAPDLFERGVTFGSSAIAEAMFHFGLLGVFLSGGLFSFFSNFLSKIAVSDNVWCALLFFVFAPRLFFTVRGDLIGWIFDGMIFYFFSALFLFFINRLFVSGNCRSMDSPSSFE